MKEKNSLHMRLLVFSYQLENNRYLEAIKKGFLMVVPVLFVGAVALVIKSFPVPAFQGFLAELWGGSLLVFLNGVYQATYGLLSIYITMAISMVLARDLFPGRRYLQVLVPVLSVVCLAESLGVFGEAFEVGQFGNTGVFTAIVVSLLVPLLFRKFQSLVFHQELPNGEELDDRVFRGIMLPFVLCIGVFFFVNTALYELSGSGNLNELFAAFFGYAFRSMGPSLWSGLLFLFMTGILWFFGIHGGNALELVSQNTFVPTNTDPTVIMSKSFLDVFGLMGGCGATLCLVIAILLFATKKKHRNLAKVALPTVLFNVNEIVVFGFPIIFNPLLLIPFVCTPMVSVGIAYLAARTGFMPIPCHRVEWTTPVLLSGYVLTGSVRGLLVQLVGIAAGVALYVPFLRMLERMEKERDDFLIGELEQICIARLEDGQEFMLSRLNPGALRMSTALAEALAQDIRGQSIPMHYQPQVDRNGKMVGVEALLRWEYNGRRVLSPLVIALAKEKQLINDLSLEILRRSTEDLRPMLRENPEFKMSVNMVAEQMNEGTFVERVAEYAREQEICHNLCIEITEETGMDGLVYIPGNIRMLKRMGIRFAMDDFSMGHTSLKYLQDSLFDCVKLDGELVKDLMTNRRSEEIIASIIALGDKLQFDVIAEYVDDPQKAAKLLNLGCDYLQGYLYSPAVPVKALAAYAERQEAESVEG